MTAYAQKILVCASRIKGVSRTNGDHGIFMVLNSMVEFVRRYLEKEMIFPVWEVIPKSDHSFGKSSEITFYLFKIGGAFAVEVQVKADAINLIMIAVEKRTRHKRGINEILIIGSAEHAPLHRHRAGDPVVLRNVE